ncbi:NYN domain-containing protein [Pacificimonas sp. WHA3]|uniref:NYN domain-containing protein n=1 Tax=Pacificimonas pallii TaxID=2827236 RepID=A0ABS6SB48_9SPHN|nr:NYN domain-containing protein [Pacificimonas pallii]
MKRILIFVDEANFAHAAYQAGKKTDYIALADYLADEGHDRQLVEMVVYLGLPPAMRYEDMPVEWQQRHDSKIRFRDFLRFNGFMAVTHHGKGSPQRPETLNANVDVLMAMDAVEMCLEVRPDVVVLVTGDADFHYLAEKLRRRGIRVEVASTKAQVSLELQKAANDFIDLSDFMGGMDDWENHRDLDDGEDMYDDELDD